MKLKKLCKRLKELKPSNDSLSYVVLHADGSGRHITQRLLPSGESPKTEQSFNTLEELESYFE